MRRYRRIIRPIPPLLHKGKIHVSAHSGFVETITHRSQCESSSTSTEFHGAPVLVTGVALELVVRRSHGRIWSCTFYCDYPGPEHTCLSSLQPIPMLAAQSLHHPMLLKKVLASRGLSHLHHTACKHQSGANIPPHPYLSCSRLLARGGSHLCNKGFVSLPSPPK